MNSEASKTDELETSTDNQTVLSCQSVVKTFTEGELHVEVLKGVNLSIARGEQVAIMGSSGSGKSTLLHILGGLDNCTSGEVNIVGINPAHLKEKKRGTLRNQYLGFVYQFHHLLPEFTALENVAMPLLIRGENLVSIREKAQTILQRVGLGERLGHKPGELSGGERQRTAIARALISNPVCILADEPTGNLDNYTANAVYDLILELNQEFQTSILMVTHDEKLAKRLHRTLILSEGLLHE